MDSCEHCVELEHTLDLIRDSDMRAIKMWREAHPGNELVWPDRAKMIFWLLEQRHLNDLMALRDEMWRTSDNRFAANYAVQTPGKSAGYVIPADKAQEWAERLNDVLVTT